MLDIFPTVASISAEVAAISSPLFDEFKPAIWWSLGCIVVGGVIWLLIAGIGSLFGKR